MRYRSTSYIKVLFDVGIEKYGKTILGFCGVAPHNIDMDTYGDVFFVIGERSFFMTYKHIVILVLIIYIH